MIKNGEIQVNKLIEIDELKLELKNTQKLYLEALNRIDKAIEYIQKRFEINEYGEYYFTHTFDNSNMKELLEILGGINEHRK